MTDSIKRPDSIRFHGITGRYNEKLIRKFLVDLPERDPMVLKMFTARDRRPLRHLLGWSGEFAGKYLTSCGYAYRISGDEELKSTAVSFADELIGYIDGEGYLGPYAKECRLTGRRYPKGEGEEGVTAWEGWNHYHIMYGLILWYEITGKKEYFEAAERLAALFMAHFYGENPPLISIGNTEINISLMHIFGILYLMTKKEKKEYLDFALSVEEDIDKEGCGRYLSSVLGGKDFHQCHAPRWESLHAIMGYLTLYDITGEDRYLEGSKMIYSSIKKTDVHNTGSFSTNEGAIGTPYENGKIETCCAVAFDAFSKELFFRTFDPAIIDQLELAHYNGILGSISPSGYWSTYNTPMEGTREANYHTIGFQCRAGTPDINCCSVNAPRGVAEIGEWAVSQKNDLLYINCFESLIAETELGTVKISGGYPYSGNISLSVSPAGGKTHLAIRIPAWSKNTTVVAGGKHYQPESGKYFLLDVSSDTEIEISLDFTPYTAPGGGEYEGKRSLYSGPILYGLDSFDDCSAPFDSFRLTDIPSDLRPVPNSDGATLTVSGTVLRDFCHLGMTGGSYRTWL
ncbi:MAG: glycoside hydrolase family 127 protein [Clostridia bacterium]|nr:glycoside hydrolase family 127 protein [Clostridia bacterium]